MYSSIEQSRVCAEKILPEDEVRLQELESTSESYEHFNNLKAVFYTSKLWPKNSDITISFVMNGNPNWTPVTVIRSALEKSGKPPILDPLENEVRKLSPVEAIKTIINRRVQPMIDLNLKFVDTNGIVRIGLDENSGAWSLLGIDHLIDTQSQNPSKTTMNFGWLDVGTVCHEFGHMLGMVHEHQNPFGKSIEWDKPKVLEWARRTQGWNEQQVITNIFKKYETNILNGSIYDPDSIMLYFYPSDFTTDGRGTTQNVVYSPTDVGYIQEQYPGGNIKTPDQYYTDVYGFSPPSSSPKLSGLGPVGTSKNGIVFWLVLCLFLILIIGLSVYIMYKYKFKK